MCYRIKYWWNRNYHAENEDPNFIFSNLYDESKVQKLMVHKQFPKWATLKWIRDRLEGKKPKGIFGVQWLQHADYELKQLTGKTLSEAIHERIDEIKNATTEILNNAQNLTSFYESVKLIWLSKYPKEFAVEVCRDVTLGEALLKVEKHIQENDRPQLNTTTIAGLLGVTKRQVNNKFRGLLQRDSKKYWDYQVIVESSLKFCLMPNL